MDRGPGLRSSEVVIIALLPTSHEKPIAFTQIKREYQKKATSFLIERRLGIGDHQKALDSLQEIAETSRKKRKNCRWQWGTHQEDVGDAVAVIPIPLQSVHADLASRRSNIGVEDLGDEESLGGRRGEVGAELELDLKGASLERRLRCGRKSQN